MGQVNIDPDRALRETMTRVAAIAQDPLSRGDTRTLAAGMALIILALQKKTEALEEKISLLEGHR